MDVIETVVERVVVVDDDNLQLIAIAEPGPVGPPDPAASYSVGIATAPTITYASPNVVIAADGIYYANENADYSGRLVQFSPAGASLECTAEETVYYVYAINTGGAGVLGITTDIATVQEGRAVLIATVIRTGTYFHTTKNDHLALGHVSKLQHVMEDVFGFRRMDGMEITVIGTRNLAVTLGTVARGGVVTRLDAIDSSIGDTLFFVYWDGAAWQRTTVTQLNNTQYQTPAGLATLSNNWYMANWIWRGVESQKHVYVLLGWQYKTLEEAEQSGPPTPPAWITAHAIFAGRALFREGVDAPVLVQNAGDLGYVFTGAVAHNTTTDKQGAGPEYYHLSLAQYLEITSRSPFLLMGA